jgi:hypothetical protein
MDNVPITPGTGKTFATDEISTVHYPRNKLIFGADGTNEGDVSKSNGLPTQESQPATKSDLTEIAFGTLSGTYANLSVTGISGAKRLFVWNDTDANIYLSEDAGTTDHEKVPAKSSGYIKLLAATTALHGKYEAAPTEGKLVLRTET